MCTRARSPNLRPGFPPRSRADFFGGPRQSAGIGMRLALFLPACAPSCAGGLRPDWAGSDGRLSRFRVFLPVARPARVQAHPLADPDPRSFRRVGGRMPLASSGRLRGKDNPGVGASPASSPDERHHAQDPRTEFETEPRDSGVRRSGVLVHSGEGRDTGRAFGSPCRSRSAPPRMAGRNHRQILVAHASSHRIRRPAGVSGCVSAQMLRTRSTQMWNTLRGELREVVWLASVVGVLSVLGVAIAVALSAALPALLAYV